MCNIEQKKTEGLKRALGMMGLAVRAGKVVFGTPMVCDFIKDAREREIAREQIRWTIEKIRSDAERRNMTLGWLQALSAP